MNLIEMLVQANKTATPTKHTRASKAAPIRNSIVQHVQDNPGCTMLNIQVSLGLSDRSVASWMHRLHKDGTIAREQYSHSFNGHRPRYKFYYKEMSK